MKILTLLPLLLVVCLSSTCAQDAKQPNILVIISDDLGYGDVGLHGSKIPTPNLDKLVKQGVKLDRFYVHPQCSATRMTMLTGRNSARFGVLGAIRRGAGIPETTTTLPKLLQSAGYHTALIGKWHLGNLPEHHPQRKGFDSFYGHLGGSIDYFTHVAARRPDWERDGKAVEEEGYATDLLAAEAVRIIKRHATATDEKRKPFYLQLAFNAPHVPLQAPEADIEHMRGKVAPGRETYAAMVSVMDRAIGKVVGALDASAAKDNTLVLFFNDNGAHAPRGPRTHYASNGPLSGGKSTVGEGGIRVLAAMRWAERFEAASVSSQLSGCVDLLPTLCAAAGVAVPPEVAKTLDGENLWEALKSGKNLARNPIVVLDERGSTCVMMDHWKLVTNAGGNALFNLKADPGEKTDLSADKPKTVRALLGVAAPFDELR